MTKQRAPRGAVQATKELQPANMEKDELLYMFTHTCRAHQANYASHPACYVREHPQAALDAAAAIHPATMGAPELTPQAMAAKLSQLGYAVERLSQDKMDRNFVVDPSLFEGDTYKVGVVSCTHLGSKFQQLSHLRNFYQRCHDQGVKVVLHTGDLVDGMNVYAGQEFELFQHGFDAQRNYAIENYPRLVNGKTLVIAGNHDYSFVKEGGADILEDIASRRPDIEYLGALGAYPIIGPLKIYMQHGAVGMAYARSYRLQKNIESFAPEAKPDIYFLGHFHVGCYLPAFRNVFGVMVPCFQSQTPFERRRALYPEIAGIIVEITVNNRDRVSGFVSMKMDWVPFYVPKEKDY